MEVGDSFQLRERTMPYIAGLGAKNDDIEGQNTYKKNPGSLSIQSTS